MALPSIVQTAQGATSAAAPATVAPAWAASQAGTLLVVVFGAALSGAPTITPPAGWTSGVSPFVTNGVVLDLRCFFLTPPNNPGGITTATWTLANVNGIAWGMYEIAGAVAFFPFDQYTKTFNNIATSISPNSNGAYTPLYTDEFWLAAIACISTATIGPMSGGGRLGWTAGPTATSTVGATNATVALGSQLQGAGPIPASVAATLSGSVAWSCMLLCFLSTSTRQLVLGGDAANYVQF